MEYFTHPPQKAPPPALGQTTGDALSLSGWPRLCGMLAAYPRLANDAGTRKVTAAGNHRGSGSA